MLLEQIQQFVNKTLAKEGCLRHLEAVGRLPETEGGRILKFGFRERLSTLKD